MKIPEKICSWIKNFLEDRKFRVALNGLNSIDKAIVTGVPQGAILSPILFLIFINDIPLKDPKYNDQYSLLFADDLFHFNSNKNLNYLKVSTQSYLNDLDEWMNKWRLKISAHKSSFNLYKKSGIINKEIELKIFGEKIKMERNPEYLGIILDSKLTFKNHVAEVKERCIRKLSILKALNYKKYKLPETTKIKIYTSLIRSVVEYGAPLWKNLSDENKKELEAIQYHALRIIANLPIGCTNSELYEHFSIPRLVERFENLHERYVYKSLNNNELLSDLLDDLTQMESYLNVENLFN